MNYLCYKAFFLTLTELVYLGEAKIAGSARDLSMEGAAFRLKKILTLKNLTLKDFDLTILRRDV